MMGIERGKGVIYGGQREGYLGGGAGGIKNGNRVKEMVYKVESALDYCDPTPLAKHQGGETKENHRAKHYVPNPC
jgi:hypothetical protein